MGYVRFSSLLQEAPAKLWYNRRQLKTFLKRHLGETANDTFICSVHRRRCDCACRRRRLRRCDVIGADGVCRRNGLCGWRRTARPTPPTRFSGLSKRTRIARSGSRTVRIYSQSQYARLRSPVRALTFSYPTTRFSRLLLAGPTPRRWSGLEEFILRTTSARQEASIRLQAA